jgi:F0F1-type ATP synthase membrane subunit b/b'
MKAALPPRGVGEMKAALRLAAPRGVSDTELNGIAAICFVLVVFYAWFVWKKARRVRVAAQPMMARETKAAARKKRVAAERKATTKAAAKSAAEEAEKGRKAASIAAATKAAAAVAAVLKKKAAAETKAVQLLRRRRQSRNKRQLMTNAVPRLRRLRLQLKRRR